VAKLSPGGVYVPEPFSGDSPEALRAYVYKELLRISIAFETGTAREFEELHEAPAKPREWMVVGADGTDWNPGSGRGVYVYLGGSWTKL